jgi:hypothetical protein
MIEPFTEPAVDNVTPNDEWNDWETDIVVYDDDDDDDDH